MIARAWKYGGLAAVVLLLAGAAALAEPFDHWQHRKLFISCGTCHVGAKGAGGPLFPAAADCATCHDGKVEKEVTWTPRDGTAAVEPQVRARRARAGVHRRRSASPPTPPPPASSATPTRAAPSSCG